MIKNIALVAHDARKTELVDWVRFNAGSLESCALYCTGTTGRLIKEALAEELGDRMPEVHCLLSGPLMSLVRLASLYNVPFATNRSTADFIISSPLYKSETYERIIPKAIENYKNRKL